MKTKSELIARALYAHSSPKKILDIGYAQHPNTFLKGEISGVDIVTDIVPENYKEVRNVDLNTDPLPYPNGEFDAVTMGCVLAHVSNPLKLLMEINRVLKPGGTFVMSTPNPHYYWETVINFFFNFFSKRVSRGKTIEHFYEFSRYNMRVLASRTGFKIIKEYGCSFSVIKTNIKFNPWKFPSLSYEIIYVLHKDGKPQQYNTTYQGTGKLQMLPTEY